ncbi:MAG: translation initiation factor IF-2 N-terminal domain-containing protein, partial [Deltaproteobacteria bacterium]|nr:translation initiation factor IF-2 N-terminal domain-containing protein [Deltaproteobacteria bacterium]
MEMHEVIEQNFKKVYELAKDLGLDSISLLDKLGSLNIKVKSHMSDLTEEQVKIIQNSFGKKESAKKAAPPRIKKKSADFSDTND